ASPASVVRFLAFAHGAPSRLPDAHRRLPRVGRFAALRRRDERSDSGNHRQERLRRSEQTPSRRRRLGSQVEQTLLSVSAARQHLRIESKAHGGQAFLSVRVEAGLKRSPIIILPHSQSTLALLLSLGWRS